MKTLTEAWNEGTITIRLTQDEALLLQWYLERSVSVPVGNEPKGVYNPIVTEALAGNELGIMANKTRLKVMDMIVKERKNYEQKRP